ncbi:MAG TPA: hypothetical protein ENK91_08095 [Bacteroidetes bacterium]|nr:hypothetical protein [Bacteroidota bacterium]
MYNKIFYLFLLTASLLHARDEFSSERILGIEVGYSGVNSLNEIGMSQLTNEVEAGLRIGAQNDEWRTTIVANFMKAEGRYYQKVMLDFDRFVWASLYETDSIVFKPFLGAHVGWLRYTEASSLGDNGLAYGGQMGLALNVLNEVDFDLSYKYTLTNMKSVDNMDSVVFGVNYIY